MLPPAVGMLYKDAEVSTACPAKNDQVQSGNNDPIANQKETNEAQFARRSRRSVALNVCRKRHQHGGSYHHTADAGGPAVARQIVSDREAQGEERTRHAGTSPSCPFANNGPNFLWVLGCPQMKTKSQK